MRCLGVVEIQRMEHERRRLIVSIVGTVTVREARPGEASGAFTHQIPDSQRAPERGAFLYDQLQLPSTCATIIARVKSSTTWLLGAVLIVAALAGAWLRAHTSQPVALQFGTAIDPPQLLPATRLVGQDGAPFDRTALQGHWSLMFFGFTHCPGICPLTLTTLAQVRKELDSLAPEARPHVVFVSVDPDRDTPQQIAAYLPQFDSSFVGVTGTRAAIDEFTAALGVAHKKIDAGADDYMVDHTAAIMLVDPKGRRVAVFSPPFSAEHLASDYLRVLGRG